MIETIRIKRLPVVLFLAVIISITVVNNAMATSASIEVLGNEGAIPLDASAEFSTHTFCNNSGCWDDNSGTLTVYRDNNYIGGISGEGSADWSTTIDGGKLPQGDHTFKAIACDSKSICSSSSESITIPAPVISVSAGEPEGDMHLGGTVDFVGHVAGFEGHIALYRDGHYLGAKHYETGGDVADWLAADLSSVITDAGKWTAGEHTFRAIAVASSGSQTIEEQTITIPAPDITITVGEPEGDMHLGGTVDFVGHVAGFEGYISLYRDGHYLGAKHYETGGDVADWLAANLSSVITDAGKWTQGDHVFKAIAVASSGSQTIAEKTITIDNTPKVEILGHVYNETGTSFDIIGTVEYKEHVGGNEGTLRIDIREVKESPSNWIHHGTKTYTVTHDGWKYSKITGHELSQSTWGGKEIEVRATATAHNGAKAEAIKSLTPDLGCPFSW